MTQPTKDQLIAARDAISSCINLSENPRMSDEEKIIWSQGTTLKPFIHIGTMKTIRTLLDSHINPPDLEGLKREVVLDIRKTPELLHKHLGYSMEEVVGHIIDHLAPRIVREGFVVVPEEPTEKQWIEYANACPPFTTYMFDECKISAIWRNQSRTDHIEACKKSYKAMIAASKG